MRPGSLKNEWRTEWDYLRRFATTFCDLRNYKVFDVVEGKSATTLEAFLNSLKGRERIRLVCIDKESRLWIVDSMNHPVL